MAQTVKITPALGKLEFIGDISLAASTSAIFTGNTAGSISLVFPASQGISITGSLTVSGSAKFSSLLDSANDSGTLNYVIAANGSGGYTWTSLNSILGAVYVPLTRNITIDGVTQDLSADRTWNILPINGLTGQILAKTSDTSYDVQWIDNYTSTVKHLVKLSEAMTAGTPVYVSGSTGLAGTNMIVSKASNSTEMGSSKTLGLLESGGNANDIVFVVTEGLLEGLDTSTASPGDPVWLGTNGTLIFGLLNKPTAPAHLVFIGVVTRAQQNNGEIFVKVQNGYELDELHDVKIVSATSGQLLRRDTDGLWKNWTPNYITAETDTLASVTGRGATTSTAISITNSTQSTSSTSGALTVTGGVGIGGNLYVGGNLVIGGTTTTVNAQNLTVSDNMIYLNNGIQSTIIGIEADGTNITYTTEEAHNYLAGMSVTITGVDPDVYNFSNRTITAVETNSFTIAGTVTDPPYASGGTARAKSNANPDIGFAAGYNDGSYAHTGLFRDASDNVYKFFKGYTPEPDASPFIDTTHPSFQYASVRADQITGTSFIKVGGTSSQFLKADGSVDSTAYLSAENDPYRVTSVAVTGTSTKTITITRADSTTVTTTWTDYDTDTNTYVTSAAFNTGNGILTLTRNDAGTVTVDLDGRYSEIGHTHTVSTGVSGLITVAGTSDYVFSIDSRDRRALIDLPNTFDRGLYLDFKNSGIFPEIEASGYRGQMIWRSYGSGSDMSGGYPIQIVYDQAGDIHYRLGVSASAWADQFSTVASQQWVTAQAYLTTESDPTVPSHVKSITTTNISNWNAAYNDKVNSASFNTSNGILTLTQQDGGTITVDLDGRYLTSETDSQTLSWIQETLTLEISNGNQVILTGLATESFVTGQGYITGYTETDPTVPSHVKSITTTNISNWNAAYNDKVNSASFNTADGILTLTQQDGGTVTVDLDGRYLTSETDSQTLTWIPETITLEISNGNSVELTGLATESFVTSQGYITGESDTLATVTTRGATTTNSIQVGKLGIGRNAAVNESIAVENPEGTWLIQGYRSGAAVGGIHTNSGILSIQSSSNGEIRFITSGNVTWGGNVIATQSYVNTAISNLVDSAPATLDTLNELAAALGDDANFATTVTNSIAAKVAKAGDTMTGALTINTTGTAGAATLRLNNSSSATFIHTIEALGANMTSGQHNILVVGKAGSTKNSGYIGYTWVGDASNSNYVTLGHWGNDDLVRIYGNGDTAIYGNTTLLNSGQLYINNSQPTIYLQDSDHRSAMMHVNSNIFYVLNGSGVNSTSWTQQANSRWALTIDLNTNYTTFGGVGDFPTDVYAGGSFRAPIFYDSANTNYYLDPNSTSILSSINADSGIADNGNVRILVPGGAYSVNSPSGTAGAIKIALPTAAFGVNTMMSMTVHIYEYSTGQSFTVKVGGYNYFTHDWYNVFAYMLSDSGKGSEVPVYFGHDGTRDVIWLGEPDWTWSYPNVFVTDFQAGHTQYSAWKTGWNISFDIEPRTNVTQTRTAYRQIDTGNIGSQSVSYATSAGNSSTTSQTNFSTLTVNGNAVWHAGNFTSTNISNWNTAYNDKINSASFNTTTGVLTLTQQDGGTVVVDLDGRYLTSDSDSQTLDWDQGALNLSISGGNTITLTGLATQDFVTSQGYITGYTETDTLATVTARGATTSTALTLSGRVTFASAAVNRPQFPGGILGLDTGDGNFDIWGISRDYYPSNPTPGNQWGLEWYGDANEFRFVGGGTRRTILDMDTGNISTTGSMTAERFIGNNGLILNSYTTVNPTSNVFLYSQPNDRDAWLFLDSADTGSNWGIYHRQIDSTVSGLPGNSIGFVGGGASTLQAYISLANGDAYFRNRLGINTTDFGYTTTDNASIISTISNNQVFVSGSIQLLNNNDAIVFGRGAASFMRDEEIGFGWGGGWYMTDATYLRVRNNKVLYTENSIYGTIFYDVNDTNYYVDPNGNSRINRLWVDKHGELGTYSWVGAALTTSSIEIVNSVGDSPKAPTLAFHWYGDGGPQFRLAADNTNILYLESAEADSANTATGTNTYFNSLRLTCQDASGVYVNGNGVWHRGDFTSTNVSNWNTAYGWGNHATQGYATQTYVNTAVSNLVDSAPDTLNTLNELAAALGDDANFATTVTNSIAAKVSKAGDTMTGELVFSMAAPQIRFADTDNYDHWIHVNSNRFYILSDRNGDGSWETPYPLELNSETNVGYVFGGTIWTSSNDGAGSGLDADTVDGYGTSTSATANTVAVRDSSANFYANYILGTYANFSNGNSENPTIGQIWTQNTSDNYLRKSTPAHFRSQITDGYYASLTANNTMSGRLTLTYDDAAEPYAQLELRGPTTHSGLYINPVAGAQAHVRFAANNELRWQIRAPFQNGVDADLEIYSWSTNNSDFKFTHGGTLTVADKLVELSSIRYKTSVEPIISALDNVGKLRPVTYTKIGKTETEIGLIAEEVAEVYPEVVKYDRDGNPDGINYSRLSVILLKAVQELTEKIKKLES